MASRFWVGGTGTWDSSTTTHWSATSGGAGGASVPGSADTVTFNGSSGGGTVTLNFGGTITLQSISVGSFTGTWDNSANNNNFTLTAALGFDNNGSGTRTINLGSATYTLSGASNTQWDTASANLTLSATSSTIAFTATTGLRTFNGATKAFGTITFAATSPITDTGRCAINNVSGTIGSLVINGPNYVTVQTSGSHGVTSLTCAGSSSGQILLTSNAIAQTATLAVTTATLSWTAFRDLTFTGSPTATNSFDCGHNSGITITAPSGGGGGVGVIGS